MVKRALFVVLTVFAGVSLALAGDYAVPAGSTLHCRLAQPLSTRLNSQDDPFTANVTEPFIIDGRDVIPVGSTVEGRVGWLKRPGRVKGVGEMRLWAEKIRLPDGRTFPLNAVLVSAYGAEGAKVVGEEGGVKGPSSRLKTIEETAGLAAGGGVVGLLFSHPVLGMALGGTAGFVDRMRRRGQDLALPSGTQLNYQLTRQLVIR